MMVKVHHLLEQVAILLEGLLEINPEETYLPDSHLPANVGFLTRSNSPAQPWDNCSGSAFLLDIFVKGAMNKGRQEEVR